jgi:hypothetical protein
MTHAYTGASCSIAAQPKHGLNSLTRTTGPRPNVIRPVDALGRVYSNSPEIERVCRVRVPGPERLAKRLVERRTRYGVKDPGPPDATVAAASRAAPSYHVADRPQPGRQLVTTPEPVGMEEAIGKLGAWVTAGQNDTRVLAIVGFGGLGKTTLALALHRKFGEKFDSRACVQASQKLNLAALLRSILKQVTPQVPDKERPGATSLTGIEGWSEKQLKEELKTHLEKKRYGTVILIPGLQKLSICLVQSSHRVIKFSMV